MIRLAVFGVFFIVCLTAPQMSAGPVLAQSQSDGATTPRAAWPSSAPSQQAAPTAAWPARPNAGPALGAPAAAPQSSGSVWRFILETQQKLHKQLADAVKGLKTGDTLNAGFFLILVSFLYGVFHAAGPGHGKAVISSYVLANGATVRRGIVLSFLAAFVQALSAIAIVSVLAIALNAAGIQIQQMVRRFETASGLLIAVTGLWLLYLYISRRLAGHGAAKAAEASARDHSGHESHGHYGHGHEAHAHGDDCGCGHAHMPDTKLLQKNWSLANAVAIVFAIGIRPCTGAILVLVFALMQGLFWAGVGATFAMAFGTAITVSTLAVLSVGSRDLALRFAGSRLTTGIYDLAAVGGSLLVMLLGAGLFWTSLGPASPF
jgi:ABC-type nickel/cobalt efflux system permease component RcnA